MQDNKKDPLLFADLGNGQYYLIHKWGEDLSWYRGLALFPLRNIGTLAITTMLIAFFLVAFMPNQLIPENYLRTSALTFFFKAFSFFILNGLLFTVLLISGIIAVKDFSENVWNSKYFN